MWREIWLRHRAALCSAAGVLCFLAAGLMVRFLPGVQEKLVTEKPERVEPAPPRPAPASLPASSPESSKEVPAPPVAPRSAISHSAGRGVFALEEDGGEAELILYITGSVRKPGVYRLPSGSRLFRLVELAGGLNSFADPAAINMAAPLEDGMHVHVPKREDQKRAPSAGSVVIVGRTAPSVASRPRGNGKTAPIDINRATAEELTALKGIGPVLAKKIVDYRTQNGRFRNLEDLLQVRGIGKSKLETFRSSVTVGP
ncbi:MAG: ComEA family DNA-binding protein [Synergistaceae bacterium]|jgi:competence protein ComEA|nr:ComEA family DNA-binding protein [Synergistaceae bacterium]